jgi:monofunctional glycosyltransferase
MVIIGEDSRFWTHYGVDVDEIRDALGLDPHASFWATARALWRDHDRVRGASTITQQLAKNLYLSPSRSVLRKLKEAVTALRLELALPKDRILALYLATAEWGPGIWGAEAASRSYFGVPPDRLTPEEAAALAATLPFPSSSTPVFRPERMLARQQLILARYYGADVAIPPAPEVDTLTIPELPPVEVPPFDSLLKDTATKKDST